MLRVISGTAKGHKLKTLKGYVARPTSDKVKESLFNIIVEYLADAYVLDLFAGTGNLGIEALSRGARKAVFVDKSEKATDVIRENLVSTKLIDRGVIIKGEVLKVLYNLSKEGEKFDIIFLDPPYNKGLLEETLKIIEKEDILAEGGIIAAERSSGENIPQKIGNLELISDRRYGNTALAFYKQNNKILNRIEGI
ncbi:MAG: 16S rRNA (guanine(966)-N(2))-methyltransferase RsmD [Firmicutes bacterium]|nr:16S rRNA (guanine(966)-N(2))-methyltransferase RsmD [Bacillota bacterium]